MFIGHFGVGFGAKKAAPRASLGTLFIAAQFLDLLWPTLLILGVEHVAIAPGFTKATPLAFTDYPISHSLLLVVFWGFVVGGIYWLRKRNVRYAVILGACVVSHWILDLLVHAPDLPLTPGVSPKFGFGLWNVPSLALLIEGTIFLGGLVLYMRATSAKNAVGRYGLAALVGLLLLSHAASMLGPPPPNVAAIAWVSQAQWLFVVLAFWVDRNRMPKDGRQMDDAG